MTALEELFSEYYKDVYRYLYSLCRSAPLSEDLASETFLEVVKSIGSFRADSDVKTWMFSIARHRWYSYLRKKKRAPEAAELYELTELEQPSGKSAEDEFLRGELVKRVYELINAEPERSRRVALMRAEGYSFYEIGKAVGISESSARVTFFRTKEKIRKKLKEEGFDYE
ncbi:MAG: RNA polymerase sigma factor [Lachnospiraceae bacterium]|nr:RNA polymerase sigma factor [Ruminococcus sp.]MCM1276522.1 RNA polymerase sigma factor [Lachnospiraceae bacterium]